MQRTVFVRHWHHDGASVHIDIRNQPRGGSYQLDHRGGLTGIEPRLIGCHVIRGAEWKQKRLFDERAGVVVDPIVIQIWNIEVGLERAVLVVGFTVCFPSLWIREAFEIDVAARVPDQQVDTPSVLRTQV